MRTKVILTLAGLCLWALPAHAQNFSCNIGDRPSCLGFGETVCSSSGMCVDQDAQCFNRYQCDYEGFTCKSNVTDCVDDYNELLRTHNSLVDDYNGLLDDLREVRNIAQELEDDLDDVQSCLIFASTLEDARFCAR